MRRLVFHTSPSSRLFQVFDGRRRCVGTWEARAESRARAELDRHHGGYMLVLDEYLAKLPHLGHCYRVVVDRIQAGQGLSKDRS